MSFLADFEIMHNLNEVGHICNDCIETTQLWSYMVICLEFTGNCGATCSILLMARQVWQVCGLLGGDSDSQGCMDGIYIYSNTNNEDTPAEEPLQTHKTRSDSG